MKRMTSNEYNPCFNCNFYSSCSHIRENFPVCPERARYDRFAAIEDILGDEYDLERLRVIMDAEQHGGLIVGYGPGDPGEPGEPGELGVMEEVAADNVVVVSAESAGTALCRQGLRRDMESLEPFPVTLGHATGET